MLTPPTDPAGRFRKLLSDAAPDARNDFIAFLFFHGRAADGLDAAHLPAWVTDALKDFAARAGVTASQPLADRQAAVEKWFQLHRPDPTLLGAFNALGGALPEATDPGRRALDALGVAASSGVLGGGARPAGSTPGGLLGQIAAMSATKKTKTRRDP